MLDLVDHESDPSTGIYLLMSDILHIVLHLADLTESFHFDTGIMTIKTCRMAVM
jgi:hypothetical protein